MASVAVKAPVAVVAARKWRRSMAMALLQRGTRHFKTLARNAVPRRDRALT
jgi:hypothetical protein